MDYKPKASTTKLVNEKMAKIKASKARIAKMVAKEMVEQKKGKKVPVNKRVEEMVKKRMKEIKTDTTNNPRVNKMIAEKMASKGKKRKLVPTWKAWWKTTGLKQMPYTLKNLREAGTKKDQRKSLAFYNYYRNKLIEEYKKKYPRGTQEIKEIPFDHVATDLD
tara:strand:+ start:444 stop:932 length:489 start_codon:yes stop_codon:yes gene_type:complete